MSAEVIATKLLTSPSIISISFLAPAKLCTPSYVVEVKQKSRTGFESFAY